MLKILTYAYGPHGPKFITLQHRSLKRFIANEFEYVVFNTSEDHGARTNIERRCAELGIPHIHAKRDISFGSHASALKHSWQDFRGGCDYLLMLDFDMLLTKPFNAEDFLKDHDIAGLGQSRGYVPGGENVFYLWPGFLLWNMKTIPDQDKVNLDGGYVDGVSVDTGGMLCYYLREHPGVKIKSTGQCKFTQPEDAAAALPPGYDPDYGYEMLCNCFLHFRDGSNWNHRTQDYHDRKFAFFEKVAAL